MLGMKYNIYCPVASFQSDLRFDLFLVRSYIASECLEFGGERNGDRGGTVSVTTKRPFCYSNGLSAFQVNVILSPAGEKRHLLAQNKPNEHMPSINYGTLAS
jgi:hypothetical protein